jgi:hypothetical protein
MPVLADLLADAKAEVERLERLAAAATCVELGHDMQSIGGCNAGCDETCGCSVPVNRCTRCGDCDYGDNEDATRIRRDCAEMLRWRM